MNKQTQKYEKVPIMSNIQINCRLNVSNMWTNLQGQMVALRHQT